MSKNWLKTLFPILNRHGSVGDSRRCSRSKLRGVSSASAEMLESRTLLTLFVVDTLSDDASDRNGTRDNQLSLREAITAANTNTAFGDAPAGSPDGDQIVFADTLRGMTIHVTGGQFSIADDLKISGLLSTGGLSPGLTLDAGGLSRVFAIDTSSFTGSVSAVSISDLILRRGNSAGNGGAVVIGSGESVSLTNVAIRSSVSAARGGGIATGNNSSLIINGGELVGNSAGIEGGGLWNAAAQLTILDGVGNVLIDGNVASGDSADDGGGGIFNNGGRVRIFNVSNNFVTISNNRATGTSGSGGGIFSTGGRVTIEDATIRDNSANRAGGGIEIVNGTMRLDNVNLIANDVNGSAGTANPGNGGGLHVSGVANITIDSGSVFGNTAAREGGGLWNQAGSGLTIQNGTLIQANDAFGNSADDGGGGLFNNGGVVVINGSAAAVQIVNNRATGTLGSGGGIFNFTGGVVTVTDSTISGNEAERAGGGIESAANLTNRTELRLVNVTLDGNSAFGTHDTSPGNGGGLHMTGNGNVLIADSQITSNFAALEGGGLWNGTGRMFVQGGTVIDGNVASGDSADDGGGGIFNNGGRVRIFNVSNNFVTISNNRATGTSGSGGGIFSTGGRVTIEDATIRDNSANRAGGGIEIVNGTMRLDNVNLIANDVNGSAGTANPGNGGGLHVSGVANITIDSGSVFGNTAAREGGGLWNQAGSGLTIQNGTLIQANDAFGNSADDGGGGLFNNGGVVVINGSAAAVQIVNNRATGTLGSGGGIFNFTGGVVTVTDSTISGNEAERAGGGIESAANLTNRTELRLVNVTLDGNSAFGTHDTSPGNGGGLHVAGIGKSIIVNSTISGNLAAGDGGGIWTSAANGHQLTITNSTIAENHAFGSGGGIWGVSDNNQDRRLITLNNSIVATNTATGPAPDIRSGMMLFASHSVVGINSGSGLTESQSADANGNFIGSASVPLDPGIGSLQDNGGHTRTHALAADSVALDRGSNSLAVGPTNAVLTTDQRGPGFSRIRFGTVDIGAFESETQSSLQSIDAAFASPLFV